jgi:hypothetical protein
MKSTKNGELARECMMWASEGKERGQVIGGGGPSKRTEVPW